MEVSVGNFTVNQFASTLWLFALTQNLTFLLPTNPQRHRLHFCMILSPPGPRRDQGRAKPGLFLDLLSFSIYHLCSVPQQKLPLRLWSLRFRSLSGCAGADICFHLPLLFVVLAFSEWDESHIVL